MKSRPTTPEAGHERFMNDVDDAFIEQIWHDLDGQVPRELIRQMAAEVAAEFRTATVTTFVPIFIRRQVRAKLKSIVDEKGNAVAEREPTD